MPGVKFPIATKAKGTTFAIPNPCLTPAPPGPPVPVVYPSTAELPAMDGAVDKVVVEMKEIIAEGAKSANSQGDAPGVNGGVVSGQNMGPVQPKQFSSKVVVGGKKPTFLTAIAGHNGTNANAPAGRIIAPSTAKVLINPA